jgi:prostatic aicd phosphatase
MNYQVGQDYRARYLTTGSANRIQNISEYGYVSSQTYATSPNLGILANTATAFLQGMYPPLASVNPGLSTQSLTNGTASQAPLGGYQYIAVNSISTNSPDAIWLKGRDSCPVATSASNTYADSAEYQAKLASTKSFYAKFYDILHAGVYDYTSPSNMSFAKAFDIFDLINVARVHNLTSAAANVSDADMFQLRTLADAAEFGSNFNASQSTRAIHGQTLIGGILTQLNQTVTSKGAVKLSVLGGSYDNLLAFFGLTQLTSASSDFYGLPDYASTMAFEILGPDSTSFPSDPSTLKVRFMFRNSTYGTLTNFPLFGTGQATLAWPDFVARMSAVAITSSKQWCSLCGSTASFCPTSVSTTSSSATPASSASTDGTQGMSNAVAGVIGAAVTLGITAICALALFFLLGRGRKSNAMPVNMVENGSMKGSVGGSI